MEQTTESNPQELVAFLTLCKDYCALIEHASEYSRADFVQRTYGYLPEIFSYLSQMPATSTEELEDWLTGYTQVISDETVSYYEEQVRALPVSYTHLKRMGKSVKGANRARIASSIVRCTGMLLSSTRSHLLTQTTSPLLLRWITRKMLAS